MTPVNVGFFCDCGDFHAFGGYVMAHPRAVLIYECQTTGSKFSAVNLGVWRRFRGARASKSYTPTYFCPLHPRYAGLGKPTSKKAGCLCRKLYEGLSR